jgi:hypothetical protein
MGRAAGAALTVVAPEAKVASMAAGGRRRRPPVPDPRVTAPGSEAARQRQAVEDIKAARPPEPTTEPAAPPAPSPASPGGGPSLPAPPASVQAAASTGSGVLLGLFTWGLVLSYLGLNGKASGTAGVKAFLAAKFLNKT